MSIVSTVGARRLLRGPARRARTPRPSSRSARIWSLSRPRRRGGVPDRAPAPARVSATCSPASASALSRRSTRASCARRSPQPSTTRRRRAAPGRAARALARHRRAASRSASPADGRPRRDADRRPRGGPPRRSSTTRRLRDDEELLDAVRALVLRHARARARDRAGSPLADRARGLAQADRPRRRPRALADRARPARRRAAAPDRPAHQALARRGAARRPIRRPGPRPCTSSATRSTSRSRSSARSPTASIRRCSATAGWWMRCAARSSTRRCPCTSITQGVTRHPREVETAVYFACLEAVQNAIKHASGATGLWVSLRQDRCPRVRGPRRRRPASCRRTGSPTAGCATCATASRRSAGG